MLDLSRTTNVVKNDKEKSEKVTIGKMLVQDKFIHEHDFVMVKMGKESSYHLIQCVTCGEYFCQLCGKKTWLPSTTLILSNSAAPSSFSLTQ